MNLYGGAQPGGASMSTDSILQRYAPSLSALW
jgi:hypothetical protein